MKTKFHEVPHGFEEWEKLCHWDVKDEDEKYHFIWNLKQEVKNTRKEQKTNHEILHNLLQWPKQKETIENK